MALSFDLLTGLTVAGIAAILAIYVIVVYKKGWLKRESKADQAYYLCPNQNCKRVFKKPVWLTDLSRTPPESYQACPHCGVNIQAITSPSSLASSISDAARKPSPSFGEVRSQHRRLNFVKKASATDKRESNPELSKSALQASTLDRSSKSEDSQLPKPIIEVPDTRRNAPERPPEPPKKNVEKSSSESARKCSHFFGYVRTLPKNTPIPDECLWCPSIVDCLTQESRVEAEA